MRIGVIQASSQAGKNRLLFETVRKYASGHEAVNFGCRPDEPYPYSYVEISVLIGLLLASGAVDFVVTGCSSGQGMMLACNSMPRVLCGYAPSPTDAWLFAQLNCGNAISLPLGEGYTWAGYGNFEQTIARLFSEPFGQGWPKEDADRKLRDTRTLKAIRRAGQTGCLELMDRLDPALVRTVLRKKDVVGWILLNGEPGIAGWLRKMEARLSDG